MPANAEAVYLDSSALVKLVIQEAETDDLAAFLVGRPVRVSSALSRAEVIRAVRSYGPEAVLRAREVLQRVRLLHLDDDLLDAAADLDPVILRSLDAIHLASAQMFGNALRELVTYVDRMVDAARNLGFTVIAPGA